MKTTMNWYYRNAMTGAKTLNAETAFEWSKMGHTVQYWEYKKEWNEYQNIANVIW